MATNPKGIVRRDDFIKNVRPDPKSTDELVTLRGYIGDSDLDGHVRVYADAGLSDFIELPERDILYSDPVSKEEDPLGGSRLWVKKTTIFTTGNPNHANRIKSSFLQGDLVKAFGNQAARMPGAVPQGIDINSNFVVTGCGPVTEMFEDCAPTNDFLCEVLEPPFTVGASICQITCPHNPCFPTRLINCVTRRFFCPPCVNASIVVVASARCFNQGTRRIGVNPVGQPNYGYAAYRGGFNPYQTGNFGY